MSVKIPEQVPAVRRPTRTATPLPVPRPPVAALEEVTPGHPRPSTSRQRKRVLGSSAFGPQDRGGGGVGVPRDPKEVSRPRQLSASNSQEGPGRARRVLCRASRPASARGSQPVVRKPQERRRQLLHPKELTFAHFAGARAARPIPLYGAVCPQDGACVYLIMRTSNTVCFQSFLNVLSRRFAWQDILAAPSWRPQTIAAATSRFPATSHCCSCRPTRR